MLSYLRSSSSKTLPKAFSLASKSTLNSRMVHTVKSASEFKSSIEKDLVVVDFFATWCGPCKMVAPLLEKMEPQYPNVKFIKIDIEEVPEIAAEYQVSAVPTFIYFKDGKVVNVVRGAAPANIKTGLDQLK